MSRWLSLLGVMLMSFQVLAADDAKKEAPKALSFTVNSIDGKPVELSKYAGKVILVVNVASECGLTPQYESLQALSEKYKEKGLVVLGFPCNQFGSQEPGSPEEIKKFCTSKYSVTFDLFSKIDVNGDKASDFYKYLTSLDVKPKGKGKVSWNFEKFLIDREGNVVARFEPRTEPDAESVISAIEKAL